MHRKAVTMIPTVLHRHGAGGSFPPSVTMLCALILIAAFCSFLPGAAAQFVRPYDRNVTTITSPLDSNIRISYKEPRGVCKTAVDSQQQYTGWVNAPGPDGKKYETNLFFWFVAARQPTPMLTVWLNGGPGTSSLFGMFTENGPCEVVELAADKLGTAAREWGWDRASNMLFIDQPNQVGWSYDVPTNGTLDVLLETVAVPPSRSQSSDPLILDGTFSSQKTTATSNSTWNAAHAVYHLMQGFLVTFPQYRPPDGAAPLGVNLFAESYGGKYGPVFADKWAEENAKRRNDEAIAKKTVEIRLASLGIVNGCIDDMIMGPSYSSFLVNNTYGIDLLSPAEASRFGASFSRRGGCQDLTTQCRALAADRDPGNTGGVTAVNTICSNAVSACNAVLLAPYRSSGRSYYDIAHEEPDSFPPSFYLEYLNSVDVQRAVGAPINFTQSNTAVYRAFLSTGDWQRGPLVPAFARLLKAGVRIGLMYGDRDFICNWVGGEAVSLALAEEAGGAYAKGFPGAGYSPITVNNSYVGGLVRQFGNLSFSRVFQAGHMVPSSQPETSFQIFARIILGTSVSTGEKIDSLVYNTTGARDAMTSLPLPRSPEPTCFLRAAEAACRGEQISSLKAGKGVIINGAWYAASSNWRGVASPTVTLVVTAAPKPENMGTRALDPGSTLRTWGIGLIAAWLLTLM